MNPNNLADPSQLTNPGSPLYMFRNQGDAVQAGSMHLSRGGWILLGIMAALMLFQAYLTFREW